MKNLSVIITKIGEILGKKRMRKLDKLAKNAESEQLKVLKKVLKDNCDTVYGKKNNFEKVTDIKSYQSIVPLSRYEDYDEAIYSMVEGEKGLITNYPICRYAESSGSTGKPKLIPISQKAMANCFFYGFEATVGCAANYFKKQGKPFPQQKGLLTVEVVTHDLPNGKTSSDISVLPIHYLKPVVQFFATSPKSVIFPPKDEPMDMHYIKLRYALADENVSYMGTIFITMLETMFEYMEQNWQMLVDDIEKSVLSENVAIPQYLRAKLSKKLKPMPQRAAQLRKEFEKGFDTPIIPRIWKKACWLYGMGTGSLSLYEKKLRRYIGPDIAMHYLGYAASEGLMAVPKDMNSCEFVMLPQNGFYEFLPIDAPENMTPLTIGELEVGKEYEVILTNLSGLYRYKIEDVVKVTGYYKQCPTITFMYRLNQVANINDEKISQRAFDLLMHGLESKFDLNFAGYSIYADRDTTPGHYTVLAEAKEDVSEISTAEIAAEFDARLAESNPLVYPQLRNGTLGHTEFHFLLPNSYNAYREKKRESGIRLNQQKPVKIINSAEKQEFFFSRVLSKIV